jgi:hypothetical protein
MNKAFWFLIAAIALSWCAVQLMLDKPESHPEKRRQAVHGSDINATLTDKPVRKAGIPAVSGQNGTAGMSNVRSPKSSPGAYSENEPEEQGLETPSRSGMAGADDEIFDRQEVEDRMLEEQMAESLRSPAYLSGRSADDDPRIDTEDVDEEEESSESLNVVGLYDGDEFADGELEDDPENDMQSSIELEQDENFPAEQISKSEGWLVTEDDRVDFNELEERTLNAQIEESLRNPAYLQSISEEETIEEDSEED